MVKLVLSFLLLVPSVLVYGEEARIRTLSLIEVETGEVIMPLEEGTVINLLSLGKRQVTILAETDPPKVTRVLFGLDAFPRYRDENAAPYALAGDRKGRFTPWTPKLGKHVLTATPFVQDVAGEVTKIKFSVVKEVLALQSAVNDVATPTPTEVAAVEDSSESPSPSPTETPTSTPTPTPSETPLPTEASIPTVEATPVETPTPSPTPVPTPRPTSVETPLPTPKVTPTVTPQKTTEVLAKTDFALSGLRVIPPSNSTASGRCVASLDSDEGELSIGCTHTIIGPTRAGLYEGSTGEEGREICKFESAESPIVATCKVTEVQIEAFERGALYLEIKSIAYGSGDLRGQVSNGQVK